MNFFWITLAVLVTAQSAAFACDSRVARFPRDCAIQDRYLKLREQYTVKSVDLDEILEYRVMRFIDRDSWERAKKNKKSPQMIYGPAPATWNVWDQGTRKTFDFIQQGVDKKEYLDLSLAYISQLNFDLLTNGRDNVKGDITDVKLKAGEFRKHENIDVGFCNDGTATTSALKASDESMFRFQQKWEKETGLKFNLDPTTQPSEGFISKLSLDGHKCNAAGGQFVSYVHSDKSLDQVRMILAFINNNVSLAAQNKAVISPIQLAAFVQKWFVSVHPFADGNGRTSRMLEDIVLAHFNFPFAPAGDLQKDATTEIEAYTELTYQKIESMLSVLEVCVSYPVSSVPYHCNTLHSIN